MAFLLLAVAFQYISYSKTEGNFNVAIKNINTKDMALAAIAVKRATVYNDGTLVNNAIPALNNSVQANVVNKKNWYLPVEMGNISSGISYYHFALDITSPRGMNEAIYPIANGEISAIYNDSAGAKIVMIHHLIDGINYTSQYVHLSSYAPNLYVGKQVTINDYIGYMGRTGIATGVHLHIALVDNCAAFNSNDINCRGLNDFFNYGKIRYNQGFRGIYSVMNVPASWTSR